MMVVVIIAVMMVVVVDVMAVMMVVMVMADHHAERADLNGVGDLDRLQLLGGVQRRQSLHRIGDGLQQFGDAQTVSIRLPLPASTDEGANNALVNKVEGALNTPP